MTFYLQPPSGSVSYQKLEEFGLNRVRFLARLVACKDGGERREALLDADTVNWSECLIAGSVKDKISHFLVRLSLAGDSDAVHFLCKAETIFFRMRLDSFSKQEWLLFFKTMEKQLSKSKHDSENLNDVQVLLDSMRDESMSWLSLVEGINIAEEESKIIALPFQLVLRLVAKRRVVLKQGYALVPLSLIPDVLEELFSRFMLKMAHQTSQQQQQQTMCQADPRMARLSAIMKRSYQREVNPSPDIPSGSKVLTLDTMASSQESFPPCMSQLMNVLEKHHRLCHQDRIQLTLFLKELGLPLHQALLFWKREYSKPSVARLNGASCGHDWQGNERRYIYSIRHLYGLEGKRVSYTAHSCATIQGRQLSCNDNGGCPFISFEPTGLTTHLSKQGLANSDIEDIVHDIKEGRVQKACKITTTCRKLKRKVTTNCFRGQINHQRLSNNIAKIRTRENSTFCSSCFGCGEFENSSSSSSSNLDNATDRDVSVDDNCNDDIDRFSVSHFDRNVTIGRRCGDFSISKKNQFSMSFDSNEVQGDTCSSPSDKKSCVEIPSCGCVSGIHLSCSCNKSKEDLGCSTPQKRSRDEISCDSCKRKRRKQFCYRCSTIENSKNADSSFSSEERNEQNVNESMNQTEVEMNIGKCFCGVEVNASTSPLKHGRIYSCNDPFYHVSGNDKEKCFSSYSEEKDLNWNKHLNNEILTQTQSEKGYDYVGEKAFNVGCGAQPRFHNLTNGVVVEKDEILYENGYCYCGDSGSRVVKSQGMRNHYDNGRVLCRERSCISRLDISLGKDLGKTNEVEPRRRKPSGIYWDVRSLTDE